MKLFIFKFLDATIGWLACWSLGFLRHAFRLNADIPQDLTVNPPSRLLVIRPGGMGDMVLLLPALQSLRRAFPNAAIDLVCEKRNRDILQLAAGPDNLLLYDAAPFRLVGHLRRTRYDAVVDTEQFHYFSALMAILARAPARIGFKISPGRNLLYTHLVNYDLEGHETDQFVALLRPLGISSQDERLRMPSPPAGEGQGGGSAAPFRFTLTADLPATAIPLFANAGTRLVTIHPGTTTRYKQWAPERFGELLRRLAADTRLVFALVGDKRDRAVAGTILGAARLGPRAVSLAGRLSLAETAAVLARSALYVGGDSGLAHLAAALDIPTVVLFGPSDSRKWGPRAGRHAVVQRQPACAPCCIFGYHKLCHSIACLAAITVDDVESACRKTLQ